MNADLTSPSRRFNRRQFCHVGLVAAGAIATIPPSKGDNSWQADVQHMLSEFMACQTPIDDQSPCNVFLGRALQRVYGISDFTDSARPGGYMSANQIATYVTVDSKWTSLGNASSQANLTQAQGYANLMKAIIATYTAPGNGHVCLILPGMLQASGSWGLNVPNSASFFLNNPMASYVGGPLSKAFSADKKGNVNLYGRNF
jgi:hypothetical protein